jgi:uncharacterized protein (TIGR03083 family)
VLLRFEIKRANVGIGSHTIMDSLASEGRVSDFTRLSRNEWLALADRFYARLDRTLASLTPAEWQRRTAYLGWRCRDVLAHMTSAMPVNFRQVLGRALAGDPSAPPEFDTFARNAREVAARRATPVEELLREFRRELAAILHIYRAMSDADWEKPAWFFVGRVRVRTLFLVQFADNVFHERDLLTANRRWTGLDPVYSAPLVDWFLRELRPALFRPERAAVLTAAMRYRLRGAAGGEWTLTIADGRCRVERGANGRVDVTLVADAEELVCAAQARAAPLVGRLARAIDWIRGPARAEETVAAITGSVSLGWAVARRRIRVGGDRAVAARLSRAFWHFWQRTAMTAAHIAQG